MLLGTVAWLVDEHDTAQRRLARAAELMLRADAPGELAQTLIALGQVRFEMGRWDGRPRRPRGLLAESPRRAAGVPEPRRRGAAGPGRRRRGRRGRAMEIVRAIEVAVDPGEWASLTCDLIRTKALAALGAGDHALATRICGACSATTAPRCTGARPCWLSVTSRPPRPGPDAPTRSCRCIDWAAATSASAQPARRDGPGPSPGQRVRSGRRAVASTRRWRRGRGDLAVRACQRRARVRRWLRRQRRPSVARGPAAGGASTFERLGAPAWAEMARSELRAAGVTSGSAPRARGHPHPQERQVVPPGRDRPQQPGDRGGALPLSSHRRHAPAPRLPQARGDDPWPASRRRRRPRGLMRATSRSAR